MKMDNEESKHINDDEGIEFSNGEYEPHPAGLYRAEFTKFDRTTSAPEFGSKLRLKLFFTTEHQKEDGEYAEVMCYASPSFSPKGRIRPMLTAMGVDVDRLDPKAFRLSEYLGKPLQVYIEHEKATTKEGAPITRAVIKGFQPMPAPKAAPAGKRPAFENAA